MRKLIVLLVLAMLSMPVVVSAAESTDVSPQTPQTQITTESLAQEGLETSSSAAAVSPSLVNKEYFLPYPGLLPDSPLYFLKVARDRVVGFLIHDSLKKAEFNLLQADKRVQAGISLLQKDMTKEQLAYTTVLKGTNYFEEAVMKTQEAKSQGILVGDFSAKLLLASGKHSEVIQEMKQKVSAKEKKKYDDMLAHLEKLRENVNDNLLKNESKQK